MIIVTGGAGFIGSNIVGRLCAEGCEVVVCDWLGTDNIKWKNLAKHPIDRVVAPEALDAYLASHGKDVTAIVHMGAISATTASDADLVVRSNFDLSRMLWNGALKRPCRLSMRRRRRPMVMATRAFPTIMRLKAT